MSPGRTLDGALDWAAVRERYGAGREVPALVGTSTMWVELSSAEALTVTQRLWRAEVTRGELEVALELLAARPPETAAVGFSEELRRHYAGGPQVQPGCSRTPNLCAVVLADLGRLSTG